jgi:hypothetical protein
MKGRDANDILRDDGEDAMRAAFDRASPKPTGVAPKSSDRASTSAISATPWTWRDPSSIPPRQWVYGQHYVRGFVSATVAQGGIGKSSHAIVEALSIVIGRDLFGGGAEIRPGRVWLFNGEDPRDEMDRRIAAAAIHYQIAREMIEGRLFLDLGREREIVLATASPRNATAVATPVVDKLIATLRERQIDMMSVDPFITSHRVSENDNAAIDAVVKALAKIADKADAAIDLVHHVRKATSGNGEVSADDARGASSLIAACRSVRVLSRMSKEDAAKTGVERMRHFSVEPAKQNLAPPSEARIWRALVAVGLGNGNNDYPEDKVAVVTAWHWPNAFDGITPSDLLAVQRRIAGGSEWRADSRAQMWAGKAAAEVLGLNINDKAHRSRVSLMLKAWVENGALKEVRREDAQRKERSFMEVGEWADCN